MPATATKQPGTTRAITKRQQYEILRNALWSERSSFDAHWTEIANYLFPVRPRFTVSRRNRGERRNQQIIDSTATFAAQTLQSGLHAGLTSPARPWMKLTTPDPDLSEFAPVKQWLFTVTQRMLTVFQLSNLYKALPSLYGDMGVFGTAAMGVLEDPGGPGKPADLFRCYQYPIGSYAFGLDNRGLVTTFAREYTKTVGQLVEEFGGKDGTALQKGDEPDWSRFSREVKNHWDKHEYETVIEVCWIVTPNRDRDPAYMGARAFPWLSCHYEKGRSEQDQVLRESGFHEFPILGPRWFVGAEDIYGTDCPGMTALGDIKQLQSQQKNKGRAIEKMINPPLQAPHSVKTQKTSLLPGDVSFVESGQGQQGIRPIHEVKPDLGHYVVDIQEVQYRINRAFHVDLFQMIATSDAQRGSQPMTAREVEERHEEKLIVLGPIVESTGDELLDPLVDRVFAMMLRAGLIPPPPPDLIGVELTVEYISMLAQAQKLAGVVAQDRFLQSSLALVEVFPQVRHKINPFTVVDRYATQFGVDPDLVRPDDEAQAAFDSEMQAAQAQAEAERMERVAKSTKALSETSVTGDTALTRMVEGAG